tara:strand:- start:812 stop:1180 length:369 start_codon:yes stop_codon:yes gene_type:complete
MAGGNYGGSSIPTTAVGGAVMNAGKHTAYSGWVCTSVVGDAAQTFLYSGQTINVGTSPVEFVMHPNLIGAVDVGLTFFCYDCSCAGMMNDFVLANMNNYTGSTGGVNSVFMPTIIGGGGLMS